MAKKPTPEKSNEEAAIVEVIDQLNFNGEDFAPGDAVEMPLGLAKNLRALGVVTFDDPTTAA